MSQLSELKNKVFAAIAEFEYEEARRDDKTAELASTCATLAVKNAELEDKVRELTQTIEKLKVQEQPKKPASDKEVLHG